MRRQVAHAIVFDPKTKKYLIIRNKKHGWDTVIIGGVENGEKPEETAKREVCEETGYTDIEFKRILGGSTEAHYFTKHKGENRIATAQGVYFELKSQNKVPIADGEDKDNEILWIEEKDFVPGKMVNSELPIWLERLKNPQVGWPQPLLDWPQSIVKSQKDWIGKSQGINFKEKVKDLGFEFEVYDSIPQTFIAQTFTVIAPEHAMVNKLIAGTPQEKAVKEFVERIRARKAANRFDIDKDMEGIFTGRYVENPFGTGDLPIWIASYVVADYGTGVVNCSAHDARDFAFAKKYNIPLKVAMLPQDTDEAKKVANLEYSYLANDGILTEPKEVKGMKWIDARETVIAYIENNKLGRRATHYKLRDWVFSRQRYWGEPIPLVHCEKCGVVAVPEKDLPVKLPKVKSYEPTGTGESPLAAIDKWVNTKCPQCGGKAKRETNTMPQWAGSSWYYLRYEDPDNKKEAVDKKIEKYWSPVDFYVGGAEHATRHLIYARFWHKFLYDIGAVSAIEPFIKLQNVGLVMGEDGRKMSKRFGNVVNPDDMVKLYGADTLRMYEMFMGPFDQQIAWSTNSMIGMRRFIERVWKMAGTVASNAGKVNDNAKGAGQNAERIIHKTIKKVTDDIVILHLNTAISSLMIAVNELEKTGVNREQFETILKLLAPFAPHMTEELWTSFGNKKSIHISSWPVYKPELAIEKTVTIAVQVNGKVRGSFEIDADIVRGVNTSAEAAEKSMKDAAMSLPDVKKWTDGKEIKKIIVIKAKLVSIVI